MYDYRDRRARATTTIPLTKPYEYDGAVCTVLDFAGYAPCTEMANVPCVLQFLCAGYGRDMFRLRVGIDVGAGLVWVRQCSLSSSFHSATPIERVATCSRESRV